MCVTFYDKLIFKYCKLLFTWFILWTVRSFFIWFPFMHLIFFINQNIQLLLQKRKVSKDWCSRLTCRQKTEFKQYIIWLHPPAKASWIYKKMWRVNVQEIHRIQVISWDPKTPLFRKHKHAWSNIQLFTQLLHLR